MADEAEGGLGLAQDEEDRDHHQVREAHDAALVRLDVAERAEESEDLEEGKGSRLPGSAEAARDGALRLPAEVLQL